MTELDYRTRLPGYYPSAWPVECGGPRRQKLVGSPGPALRPGDLLASTVRDMGGWAVMLVQRGPGELFVQGGAGVSLDRLPPHHTVDGDSAGWVERIDPVTLETLARSPSLPSGGHLWCGAIVVHANGDLYVVNGRYCHRLNPACEIVAERELPVDGPYNGLLVLSDGHLVMKNLGYREGEPCLWSILEPERLEPVGEPFVIDEPCMGRFSSDLTAHGEYLYASTAREVFRLRYAGGVLEEDPDWCGLYALEGEDQADGWDTTIGSDSVWLMDMGRPAHWGRSATAAQRAFRFSTTDAKDSDVVDVFWRPGAFSPGAPLYDPERRILVVYDGANGGVAALRYRAPGALDLLWRQELRNNVQMMLYADTGELVLENAPPLAQRNEGRSADAVIVDIESGRELGRAPIGSHATSGMFLCPGFGRDLYVASLWGTIARIFVATP